MKDGGKDRRSKKNYTQQSKLLLIVCYASTGQLEGEKNLNWGQRAEAPHLTFQLWKQSNNSANKTPQQYDRFYSP